MPLNHGKFPKQEDSYAFEEDSSSDGLSPEQHHSDESQGSACPSSEAVGSAPSSSSSPALTSPRQGGPSRDPPDQSQDEGMSGANGCQATPPIPVPAIVKSKTSSSDNNNNNKNRHKKPKDVKPKVKKLKYHQYIPPDQKASEKSPPPMDSAYARLLQQQQLFLQLQILSQQKHAHAQQASQHTHTHTQHSSSSSQQQQQHQHVHAQHAHAQAQQRQASFSYQPLHPPPPAQSHKAAGDHLSGCGGSNGPAPGGALHHSSSSGSPSNKTTYPNPTGLSPVKPGPLPANLDDLKVSELRQQLRVRGMPVSGTKTALIERLRPFRDSNNNNNGGGGGAHGGSSSPSSGSSDNVATMTFPVTPTGSLHSSSYQQSPSPSSAGALSSSHHGVCYYPYPGMSSSSTPPVSPASSSDDLSLSAEGGSLPGDSFSDVPMSSSASSPPPPPPRFHALQQQPSSLSPPPLRLSSEEGPPRGRGGGGGGGGGGEGLAPDGLVEAEKDKMLVEKQKVIEELTWKLHQEQRQVEELKMQLHKRKRCYGATQDGGPPPPPQPHPHHHHHHHHPSSMAAMMGQQQQQHFFGVTVKQEPVAPGSASSCPLLASSPKQLKSPPPPPPPGGLLMDDMSAFLSPQCSPQDSPPSGNPPPSSSSSGSPQPPPSSSSPPNNNNPYLLLSPLGCGHPLPQGGNNARGRNMQIQQKNGVQPVHCSYPSDQRGLQGVYPNSSELGLNPRAAAKANPSNMQKQLTRSQQMDELLDVLIESGGSAGLVVPKLHRHYVHLSPSSSSQLPYLDHLSANHMADSHLETLLGGPMGRGGGAGEAALLKMAAEDGGQDDERNGGGGEGYASPHGHHHHHHHHQHHPQHPHQDKLLAHNRDLMDSPNNPLSPIIINTSKVSPVGVDQQGMTIGMAFGESSWETMEWLDLTPPSSATAFHNVAPPNGPSIFNTEFLDDINLNSAMDLHLEHW